MRKSLIFTILAILLICALTLPACTEGETTTVTKTETVTETPTASPTETTTTTTTSTPVETKWWEEKWGEPKYGGDLTIRAGTVELILQPLDPRAAQYSLWFETLFGDDRLVDREEHSFTTAFKPAEYMTGWMAKGWEQIDATTYLVEIKEGIHWQDKAPAYGREFTAEDVEYTYSRAIPDPFWSGFLPNLEEVVAVNDYTVEFRFKSASPMNIFEVVGPYIAIPMVPYEWYDLSEGEQQEWENAPGTGAFMLTDYQPAVSITGSSNPDYWGYDERYPDNQLPYLDTIKYIQIQDMTTAISALRTGQIDVLSDSRDYPSISQAETIMESAPDINMTWWLTWGPNVIFRHESEIFDDINVRRAMQMSVDRETIAQTYYKGYTDGKPVGFLQPQIGESWVIPYEEWPEDIKQYYEYDPERSKQLLDEAGYGDGIETTIIAATQDDMELLQIMQAYFQEIGVDMEIDAYDRATHRALATDLKYDDMIYEQGMGQASPPNNALINFWSETENRGRFGNVSDPEFDKLVEKYFAAETLEEAQEAFKEADMYAMSQHWAVGACLVPSPQFWQSWVNGWNGESWWAAWHNIYQARMWIDK